MRDKENVHVKVQEMADCYAEADPLKEMSEIQGEQDIEEAAVKWLGLAALHGINEYAKKISIRRGKDGEVKVLAQYREVELPSPGKEIGQKILEYVREMTHIEGEGKIPLILGIRNDSIELEVKLKKKDSGEYASFKFPE